MAETKTKPTTQSIESFINGIADPQTRADCFTLVKLMKEASKKDAVMWGSSIVGFGSQAYQYASGREGDWPLIAFSPRKQDLTLYIMSRSEDQSDLLVTLGKHRVSGSCLHIKRLADVKLPVLKKLIQAAVRRKKDQAARG